MTKSRFLNYVQYSRECPADVDPLRWKAMLRQHDRHTKGRRLPVLKVPDYDRWPMGYLLHPYMAKHNLIVPCTIPVSFKDGKRRKLKRLHIDRLEVVMPGCECCSPYLELEGRMGGDKVRADIY